MYFQDIDFEGLTKKEIEILLAQRKAEALSKKAMAAYEAQQKQQHYVLPTIAEILEEVLKWKRQDEFNYGSYTHQEENEYEL